MGLFLARVYPIISYNYSRFCARELNFRGKFVGFNNLQSGFLVERVLSDFDILFDSFILDLVTNLPYCLSVPSKSVYICFLFFLERKRKHLDFYLSEQTIL